MCTETQIQNPGMGMHLHEMPRAIFPIRIVKFYSVLGLKKLNYGSQRKTYMKVKEDLQVNIGSDKEILFV